jgi:hypothetical protein
VLIGGVGLQVDERALQTAQGELTAARAEIRDLTDAIGTSSQAVKSSSFDPWDSSHQAVPHGPHKDED